MLHKPKHARARSAGLVSVLLAVGGATLALSAAATGTASAAVLGTIEVSPLTGNDSTLFGGFIANAQCPARTGDSSFSMEGPGLNPTEANLAGGNTTGTGRREFSGASIANLKSNNAGSFTASGTYTITFNCIRNPDGVVSDTYERKLNYVAGSGGAFTIQAISAPVSPLPSPSPSPVASPAVTASPAATTFLATYRAAYAAERSTLDGSLPENAPPQWGAAPP